jgi:hypothetical protein
VDRSITISLADGGLNEIVSTVCGFGYYQYSLNGEPKEVKVTLSIKQPKGLYGDGNRCQWLFSNATLKSA